MTTSKTALITILTAIELALVIIMFIAWMNTKQEYLLFAIGFGTCGIINGIISISIQ